MAGLKDWVSLNDKGLLGAVNKRKQKRQETMRELFGPPTKPEKPKRKKKKKKKDENYDYDS